MVRKKRIKESDEEEFYSSDSDRSRSPLKEPRSQASSRSSSTSSNPEEAVKIEEPEGEENEQRKQPQTEREQLQAEREANAFLRRQVEILTNIIQGLRDDISAMRKEMLELRKPAQSIQDTPQDQPAPSQQTQDQRRTEIQEEEMDTTPEPSNNQKRPRETNEEPPAGKRVANERPRETAADEGAQSSESSTSQPSTKTPKIPPIVLRQREKWSEVSRKMSDRKIQYTKAKLISEGIQVQPATIEAFRATTKMLTEHKYEYHTYALPEEKTLRAVIRGIPEGVSNDEIKEDLVDQGFKVESVQRMTSRRTKKTMPLALVKLPTDQVGIFQVNRCCALVVKVEQQREPQQITQCHRCQRFGHGQSKCTAQAKCVKCGAAHSTHECKKTRETPAKCANCQGAHPANYRGCPSCPKPTARKPTTTGSTEKRPARQATTGRSFADAAKTGKCPPTGNPSLTAARGSEELTMANLTAALAQMQQMYSAMSAFFAKMPTTMTG